MHKDGPFRFEAISGASVYTVDKVDARKVAINKVLIVINADGMTRTNGWRNPRLVPVKYVQPPPDGIWDFQFVADPPGAASDVITAVHATYDWSSPPISVKGVRIVSETNQKIAFVK